MNTAYALGTGLILMGTGIIAVRVITWRRANRPVRLAIEAGPDRDGNGLTELDRQRNADYPIYRELYHKAGYGIGGSQHAVLVAAHEAGLVNERYRSPLADSPAPWDRSYLEPAASDCVRVLQSDYEGLDPDNPDDADEWIASLERAGYSVVRGQVALDQAYARLVNEEWSEFDRKMTDAFAKFDAVASREIIDWANEWAEYKEAHGVEVATIEMQGIREWIDNELASEAMASILAEMDDDALDVEAAGLAGTSRTPH